MLDPNIGFGEIPVVLKYGFEDGGLSPDDMDLCTFMAGLWSGVAELPGTGGGCGSVLSDTGRAISLFFRGRSPSVPAPSSRPDLFGSRLWRLKGLSVGRDVDFGGFSTGNGRTLRGSARVGRGGERVLEVGWPTDGCFPTFSNVDFRIWTLEDPCPVKISGSDVEGVEGPGIENTDSWLNSSDEPEDEAEAADSGESSSAESIIWPGI